MDLWHSASGMVTLGLTSADPARLLRQISSAGVPLFAVQQEEDPLTLRLQLRRKDLQLVRRIAQKRGAEIAVYANNGIYWTARRLLSRPVLMLGVGLMLLLTVFLPTRVLFFQVEGNETLSRQEILACCYDYGVGFGSSRREVRSEKLKNALLEALPQLQWAGINTVGCVATVSVRERSTTPQPSKSSGVSSIVSALDAVVTECTVTRGTAACKPGDAVAAGQVLISGFTDCGLTIRAEQAQGEVFGQTQRIITAVTPDNHLKREENGPAVKKFSLILGKKRINFYKGSGISPDSCVKMVTEHVLTLPGGFALPVTLVCQEQVPCEISPASISQEAAQVLLPDFARSYLSRQMVAGSILSESCTIRQLEGYFRLEGAYQCGEMIGISKQEENILPNGKYE